MEKNLNFIETLTVEQFKARHNVSKLQVKQNPKTSKLFFAFGAQTGAVSSKGVPTNPMVSFVQGEPTEQNPDGKFWMLHEEAQGAPTIAEF